MHATDPESSLGSDRVAERAIQIGTTPRHLSTVALAPAPEHLSDVAARDSVSSPTDPLRRFRAEGVTIAHWSAQRGFNASLVYSVIKGRRKCLRGQSHRIAVALGLKASATPSD